MLKRLFNQRLCAPGDIAPSQDGMEVIGTFNPGAVLAGGSVTLLMRVAERPKEWREGYVASPRFVPRQGVETDWFAQDAIEPIDARLFRIRDTGAIRLAFWSYLRVVRTGADGRSLDSAGGASFLPEEPFEEYGVEDPRITPIGDIYWITYVAVSRHGACTALASTKDFETFTRHGIVFPTENKDVVLFPEKRNGLCMSLHRPCGSARFGAPEMWFATSPDLIFWGRHRILLGGAGPWEADRIGAGAPPIRVDTGWLELYHGSRRAEPGAVGQYAAAVAILDADAPWRVARRSREAAMAAEADFEREGFVPGVVFPTGIVDRGEIVQVYYGAADTSTGVVEFSKAEMVESAVEAP